MMKLLPIMLLIAYSSCTRRRRPTTVNPSAAANNCKLISSGEGLYCHRYYDSHVGFEEGYSDISRMWIWVSWARITFSPKYTKLEDLYITFSVYHALSKHLELGFQDYQNLTKLRKLEVAYSMDHIADLNFTGIGNLECLESLTLKLRADARSNCQGLKTLTKLTMLTIEIVNKFDMSCLPTSLLELDFGLYNQDVLVSAASLQNLILLRHISIVFKDAFVFDYGILPPGVRTIKLEALVNVDQALILESCAPLRNLTQVYELGSMGYPLALTCLPPNLVGLYLRCNSVHSINDHQSCTALQNQHRLQVIDLHGNNLEAFNVSCIPRNVGTLDIAGNSLTGIDDFQQLLNFPILQLRLNGNPFNCTCAFFRQFVDTFKSSERAGQVYKTDRACCTCSHRDRLHTCPDTCSSDSQLFHYPWESTIEELIAFDKTHEKCLCQCQD